ncbi:hypothetical protein EMIT0347P_20426 [Pseudomonas sp. IT-347P]
MTVRRPARWETCRSAEFPARKPLEGVALSIQTLILNSHPLLFYESGIYKKLKDRSVNESSRAS